MLFLTRSALCIGIVAVAASGAGADGVATAVDRGARRAVDEAGRACLRSEACLRMGAAALTAAAAPAPPGLAAAEPPPRRPQARAGHVGPGPGT